MVLAIPFQKGKYLPKRLDLSTMLGPVSVTRHGTLKIKENILWTMANRVIKE